MLSWELEMMCIKCLEQHKASPGPEEAFAVTISVVITCGIWSLASALAAFIGCDTRIHLYSCPRASVSRNPSAEENSCLWCSVVAMIQTLLYPKQIANFPSMEKRIHYKVFRCLKGLWIFLLIVNHIFKHFGNKYSASSFFFLVMTK